MNTDSWKTILETITAIASIATALSAIATFVTVFIARKQLQAAIEQKNVSIEQIKITIQQSQTQFEDSLAKEYRDLIQRIPVKALLGEKLNLKEFEEAKPVLFYYINLTNDQIFLRSKGRISEEVWKDWQGGIRYNLTKLSAFKKIWEEIEENSESFSELRRLKDENFNSDPIKWKNNKSKELKS